MGTLNNRHLVISDLHENCRALNNFIRIAQNTPHGFDDIWLLGDLFGHSDEATGESDLTQTVLNMFQILEKYKGPAVRGNWEHWLTHPEHDIRGKYQEKYKEQLAQRVLDLPRFKAGRVHHRIHDPRGCSDT